MTSIRCPEAAGRRGPRTSRALHATPRLAAGVVALGALIGAAAPPAWAGGTTSHIKDTKAIAFGYVTGRPFLLKDASGNPSGFPVDLCKRIADQVKADLGVSDLAVSWVAVPEAGAIAAVAQGKVDVLCDPTVESLALRKQVSFSVPVFLTGVSAIVRTDASPRLKALLENPAQPSTPTWRANSDQILRESTISIVAGSRDETDIRAKLKDLPIVPKIDAVQDLSTGAERVIAGKSNALFGDRAMLRDIIARSSKPSQLQLIDRFYSHDTLAFAVPRDDEDFRLIVDRALSRLYLSNDFRTTYSRWFGPPNEKALSIFLFGALPD
jgi:ABC-type amino acid transport substrate-binding protein